MEKKERKSMMCRIALAAALILMTGAGVYGTDCRAEESSQAAAAASSDESGAKQEETAAIQQEDGAGEAELPQAPYGVRISGISDEGIEIYWKNTEHAEGYEIYRSYEEDGTYECIVDTTGYTDLRERSHGTYQDLEFDHEKRIVYYRLRSYEYDAKGEKIYSAYTKAVKAKYRKNLKLGRKLLYIPVGMSRQPGAFYGWGNAAGVVWESDNTDVAVVDQEGKITGVGRGTCTITCTSGELQEEKSCTVVIGREAPDPIDEITARYVMTGPGCWENPDADDTGDAVIMMTGDMMSTSTQQNVQGRDTGDYNFNESFTYIRDLISSSDLAVGNLETILSSSWPYMCEETYIDNKPNCNAPSRYLDAVKYAGFDAMVMSNNHNCDGGVNGALETIQQVDRYQLARTGLFSSEEDPRTLLIDVNGIRVGFLSYTPENPGFNGKDQDWDWTPETIDLILNYYDRDKAAADIETLREAGAEYIIVYIHWGVKNAFGITDEQKQEAQELADLGVDYIVGGHSHLVQQYAEITAADGKVVPCFYSLGDFHSSINQIPGNRDSVILRLRLQRNEAGEIELAENAYIPCYTFSEYKDMHYVTIPLNPELNGGLSLKKYDKFHSRILEEVGDGIEEYVLSGDAASGDEKI